MALDITQNLSPVIRHQMQVKVDSDGCWMWIGSDISNEGYARFKIAGRRVLVHRWAFEYFVRPLMDGEVVDHLCNKPSCSNPGHLVPTSQRGNVLRSDTAIPALNARKTHCLKGHAFNEANTYIGKNGPNPSRQCRACKAERERARRARAAGANR